MHSKNRCVCGCACVCACDCVRVCTYLTAAVARILHCLLSLLSSSSSSSAAAAAEAAVDSAIYRCISYSIQYTGLYVRWRGMPTSTHTHACLSLSNVFPHMHFPVYFLTAGDQAGRAELSSPPSLPPPSIHPSILPYDYMAVKLGACVCVCTVCVCVKVSRDTAHITTSQPARPASQPASHFSACIYFDALHTRLYCTSLN